jgi:hypothetical protein
MDRIYVLIGLLLVVASAVFMGWLISWIFNFSSGPIMIVAGIIGFFGGAVTMSGPEWALSSDSEN